MKINSSQCCKAAPWLLLSILVVVLDQWSKHWIVQHLHIAKPLRLAPFFNLVLSYNPGAAFGFLHQAGGWQTVFLSTISIVVALAILIWLLRLSYPNAWTASALSLVMGGAIGNLIDRLRFGLVVDFFDFHLGGWHYATFNVADSAIVAGVLLLLLQTFFQKQKTSS